MHRKGFEHGIRVVVVEDDPTFLKFWERILVDLGVENYELFLDAKEAALMLQEVPTSLLISDIVMPDVSGFDLAHIVRKRNPGVSVVLTTGYGTDLGRFDIKDCPFHLLHKPYTDMKALKLFIQHLLDGDTSFEDISEDSFSENEEFPQVTEWKL